jgi:hypothetical protein
VWRTPLLHDAAVLVALESNARLAQIESEAFSFSSLQSILVPVSILFISSDAIEIGSQIWAIGGDCCPEFERWLRLKRLDMRVDFRRISRVGSGVRCLKDYEVTALGSEERSRAEKSDGVGNAISHRVEDEFLMVVNPIPHSKSFGNSQMKTELENLMNIRHVCIVGPIAFISRIASGMRKDLQIVRLYFEGCS